MKNKSVKDCSVLIDGYFIEGKCGIEQHEFTTPQTEDISHKQVSIWETEECLDF